MEKSVLLRALPFVVFVLLVGAVVWQWSRERQATRESEQASASSSTVLEYYADSRFGFRVPYPASYERKVIDDPNPKDVLHRSVVLTAKADTQPMRGDVPGEGPPSITIDVFVNALLGSSTVSDWVRGSPQSNFNISPDRVLAETVLDGLSAVRYRWSGLYEGESVAAALGQNVLIVAVSYREPTDVIRADFENLLRGFFYLDPAEEAEGVL